MAKRISKAESSLVVVLIVIGVPIFLAVKFFEAFGALIPIAVVAAIVALIVIARGFSRRKRKAALLAKYSDEEVVERILSKTVWVGESAGQLRDSLGNPVDIDEKVLKTKKKEVWKYAHRGGNRYGLRITVENDVVIGWDERL